MTAEGPPGSSCVEPPVMEALLVGQGPFYPESIQTDGWFTAATHSNSDNNSQERLGARKNEYHRQKIKQ